MYGTKEPQHAEAFEPYGLKWVNTSLFDDEQFAHGYWHAGGTHKVIPIYDKEQDYWEFDIFQYKRFLSADAETGDETFEVLSSPELVYSGGIDISDKEYVYKLLLNLDVIYEDDSEPFVR